MPLVSCWVSQVSGLANSKGSSFSGVPSGCSGRGRTSWNSESDSQSDLESDDEMKDALSNVRRDLPSEAARDLSLGAAKSLV
jgi:hypothetical protein